MAKIPAEWVGLEESFADELVQAVEEGKAHDFGLVLIIAVMADLSQVFVNAIAVLALIPIVGLPVLAFRLVLNAAWAAFLSTVLTIMLWRIGGFIKWKVRGALSIAASFEMIAAVSALPFHTLCVLYARHLVRHRQREAEETLAEHGVTAEDISE